MRSPRCIPSDLKPCPHRDASAQTPDYQVGMRYWENGVADDLQMDFGDFVMNGTMTEFALQPKHC